MRSLWRNYLWLYGMGFIAMVVVKTLLMVWILRGNFFSGLSMLSLIRLMSTYVSMACLLLMVHSLCPHRVMGIVLHGLLDVWVVANLIYFRTYSDLLNSWAVLNVTNMQGFWDSVLPFVEWQDGIFGLLTGVMALVGWIQYRRGRLMPSAPSWRMMAVCVLTCLITLCPWLGMNYRSGSPKNPFDSYYHDVSMGRVWYVSSVGPVGLFINEATALIRYAVGGERYTAYRSFDWNKRVSENPCLPVEKMNMVVVFFESLESWALDMNVDGQMVMPNLHRFISRPDVRLFVHMVDQTRQGKSSDAQLLLMTGLRPIEDGAVSMRFATNEYYTLADAMQPKYSKMYVPTPASEWNQASLTKAWHIDELYAEAVSDAQLVRQAMAEMPTMPQPFFVSIVTLASHSPFTQYADSGHLALPEAWPKTLCDYLCSVHYTDSCLGELIEVIDRLNRDIPTRLVVMGDHTIFYEKQRNEFAAAVDRELPAYVPFLLSGERAGTCSSETIAQVDVYTTLLHRVQRDTYWQGVGRDVLHSEGDSATLPDMSDEEQRDMSAWIIHTDAFRTD